jgi:hypothetical protein
MDHDACTGRPGVYKFQSLEIASVFEETLAAAHDNRMNHERKLIQKVAL